MKPVVAKVLKNALPGAHVQLEGWVQSVRKMKNVAFADISDGSTPKPMNVVFSNPESAHSLTTGSCVQVSGELSEAPGGKQQDFELQAQSVSVMGPAASDYPLQKKYHSKEFLRQLPHLRWKTRQAQQVLRYRSWCLNRLSNFFVENDVFQVNSPILTSSDCEGAGETFKVEKSNDFFKKPAYLSVSSQLHLEVYAASLARVWNLAPAFRAEASDTNRHLSEFWMIEAELSFLDNLGELTNFCEAMVKSMLPANEQADDLLTSKRSKEDKLKLEKRWGLADKKWETISYYEALKLLNNNGKLTELKWGDDLPSEHEKLLANELIRGPVVVTNYPKSLKPFYMKSSGKLSQEQGESVDCFDVLYPEIGEIVGGSLREDNYEVLLANMKAQKMDINALDWYLDLRKYGSFPHGGYGLGFERIITYLTGQDNIRDATGFIRGYSQLPC